MVRTMAEAGPDCVCGRPMTALMDGIGRIAYSCFGCPGAQAKPVVQSARREMIERALRRGPNECARQTLEGSLRDERVAERQEALRLEAEQRAVVRARTKTIRETAEQRHKTAGAKRKQETALEYVARTRGLPEAKPARRAYVRSKHPRLYKPRLCSDCKKLYKPTGPRGTQCGCVAR